MRYDRYPKQFPEYRRPDAAFMFHVKFDKVDLTEALKSVE